MAMKMRLAFACATLSAAASATMSNMSRFIPDPSGSLLWRTYVAGSSGIEWEWPAGALSAKLTVSGKDGVAEHVYDTSVSSYVPALPAAAGDEDVVDLTLTFYASADASGEPMAGETLSASGIGIVRGANGDALDLRPISTSSRAWGKVKAKTAVLLVPDGTTALSLDGASAVLAAVPGWHLWRGIVESRDYEWSAEGDGFSYAATLRRPNLGFMCVVK